MSTDIEVDLAELTPRRRFTVADHQEFLAALLRPADLDDLEEFAAEPKPKIARP